MGMAVSSGGLGCLDPRVKGDDPHGIRYAVGVDVCWGDVLCTGFSRLRLRAGEGWSSRVIRGGVRLGRFVPWFAAGG